LTVGSLFGLRSFPAHLPGHLQTARANASSFTLTFATGRSVGIGAYLVRLGQRTVQRASSAPIILTGFKALNKCTWACKCKCKCKCK
jgi:acetyl-CoA carboxylase carboxyltransferase component